MQWQKTILREVLTIRKGQTITKREATPGPYPVILGGREPAYYIDKYNHTGKAIVISRSGASAGYVSRWNEPIFVTDGFLIEPKADCDYDFVYYTLKSKQYELFDRKRGSAIPHVTPSLIESIKISLPPLTTQRAIAEKLGRYDALIENNTRRIAILERMAEQLYKEWFVRRRFPGHTAATSAALSLGDIIKISRGLSYTTSEIDTDAGVQLINLKNIQPYGGFRYDGSKRFDGRYKPDQVVVRGDLVMGVTDMTQDRRAVGSVALMPPLKETSVISADLIKIEPKIDKLFLYAMFRYGGLSRYISQFANGANVLHLRPQAIMGIKVQVPSKEAMERLSARLRPMIALMDNLNEQNALLAKERDLLLPRLMSGRIEVKHV